METAIRWSPSSTLSDQRFLIVDVKDRYFKRCKVKQYDGKTFEHETTSTYSKVPGFRAFDWAPHDESLVAVGSWSGEVTVLHIDGSSPNTSLPAKRQRLCNAVAFSRTGLLAAGLEGIRNDFCLNIWDVNQRHAAISSPGSGSAKQFVEPYRKFASSEAISSIKFFPGQPDVFVTGIKGKGVRIYDLRENSGNPSLLFKTDSIFNIAIDADEHYFASAGPPDDQTVHVWDCRSGTRFSAAMMGSMSDLSAQAENPVLEYKEVFQPQKSSPKKIDSTGVMVSTIWSLRYCKGKSGCLGALASTGEFKVFETKHGYSSAAEQHKSPDHLHYEISTAADFSMLTKRIHHVEHAYNDDKHGRSEMGRIVAFDFTNLASSKGTPCMIILRGDQTVEIVELDGSPSALALSSLGDLVISRPYESIPKLQEPLDEDYFLPNTVRIVKTRIEGEIADNLAQLRVSNNGPGFADIEKDQTTQRQRWSSRELHEQLLKARNSSPTISFQKALMLSTVSYRRCSEGYLFDCKKNIGLLHDDLWLQRCWTWIERSMNTAKHEGMITDTLDLSFFGVASIWNNDLDSQRSSDKPSKPTYSKEVAAAVETLCERLSLPEFRMTHTSAPNHRRLCLHTCGLGLRLEQLEEYVRDLVGQGRNTKAAALAIIHDQANLAFQALRYGNASPAHRELSLALAGYNKGNTDDTWEETVRDLAKTIDDPYARAILALVKYGDWHDVLAETSLPLRDRVGIALMYLDDLELTQYINSNLTDCIDDGDIEGIVLTGLTEQAVPLFENYICKFLDLQTAVLAISITCPRYFTDSRVELWRETYRADLNNWCMFTQRAQFDVQCTKLSTPPNGRPELQPAPRQITLRCNYCDQALDRSAFNAPPAASSKFSGTHTEKIFGTDKSGTVCPKCGRHEPRCMICMDWLGMPDPHSRGSVATGKTKGEAMGQSTTVCRKCWHMSHYSHMKDWLASHKVCPVPDCECRCGEVDYGRA